MTANHDHFMRIARFVSAFFFLVNDDKLAKKVRPSARRPGTVLDDTENGGEDPDEQDAGPAGDKSEKNDS